MKCTACSEDVRPVVAIDIDGTMARYHDHLLNFFSDYFDRGFPRNWDGSGDWEVFLGLSQEKYREGKLAFRQGGFKRWMPPYQGATHFTTTVKELGAELWVTTTRPYLRLDSVDPDTREWLYRNKVEFDHLLYHEDKYRVMAELVDVERIVMVVEDLPIQYGNAGIEIGCHVPVLVERYHNLHYRETQKLVNQPLHTVRTLNEATVEVMERITEWKKNHA